MPAFFEKASHFNVEEINVNYYRYPAFEDRRDMVIRDLYAHVASAAIHNSSARVDAPRCHEETRQAVQEDMLSWSESRHARPNADDVGIAPLEAQDILWLTGPAGTGKTAIMGTMSFALDMSGRLAAEFYFSAAMGPAGTTSKRFFVTTLAYQLAVHPTLKDALAPPILSAIRANPAIFDLSLTSQLELLVLQPLRLSHSLLSLTSLRSSCIFVDGVDECEGSGSGDSQRSRREDQIEVLSVLLQAANDPAFPFGIIVASRPETWIRAYLSESAAGRVHEIFLDERYSPDDDIRLYLKSKFAEKSRQYHIAPSTWPSNDAIDKLVAKASGQFVYAATAIRFLDTPGAPPQKQLNTLLGLEITSSTQSNAFSSIDTLYLSILKRTPDPETTLLWLKGLRLITQLTAHAMVIPSAWTINRLFESHDGEAQMVFGGLPSVLYMAISTWSADRPDTEWYGTVGPTSGWDAEGWNKHYSFYHKSFLDYLDSDSRSGAAFPRTNRASIMAWLRKRCAITLKCGGPEVPQPLPFLDTFKVCFLQLLIKVEHTWGLCSEDGNTLSDYDPSAWLRFSEPLQFPPTVNLERTIYISVHEKCCWYRPCTRFCKQWRGEISRLSPNRWCSPGLLYRQWTSARIFLDRFKVHPLAR